MSSEIKENIEVVDFSSEMKERYLEYAMSVITDRALPDIRDGLKPVHRRVLYSMHELGLQHDKKHKKSARIVGDVLGKYHPHGDTACYGAMVGMAQSFNINHTLVDGHGNFGSVDGDSPAHMRYTEAKLSPISQLLLSELNQDTVDFQDNFDGTEKEPVVLPCRFPNILVNGTFGIAVGMATDMPSHNLNEIIDSTISLIDNPNLNTEELLNYIKCPDFSTGASIVMDKKEIINMYKKGKGQVVIRSKYYIEENKNSDSIVFTEIPFKINKLKLVEKIYELSRKKNLKNIIIDVRDESDKEGMRIVVEVKKKSNIDNVLFLLFKHTKLEDVKNYTFLVLKDGEPKILNLKEIINTYIDFQKEIITRRSKHQLNKINKRLHIINGLIKALDNLNDVVKTIRESNNGEEARKKLIELLLIDDIQARAILDLRLQRLTNFDIGALNQEYNDLLKDKYKMERIISDETVLKEILKEELEDIKKKYGQPRKTEIIYEDTIQEIDEEELIENYNCKMFLTKDGYLKKVKLTSIKGVSTHKLKDEDYITHELNSTNKSTTLIFTSTGTCYKLYNHEIEDTKISNMGVYLKSHLKLQENEKIVGMVTTTDYSENIYIGYKNGQVACIKAKSYQTKQKRSKLENSLNLNSEVVNIFKLDKEADIVCISNIDKVLIVDSSKFNPKSSKNSQGNKCLVSKNDSYMVKCYPLLNKVEEFDYEYYKINGSFGIGKYLRKGDEF